MALPCRHIIYFLRSKGVEEFAANLCHGRWLKKHLPADLVGDTQVATGSRVLSQMEKYRKVHEVTEKIAEMVSEKPSALFTTFLDVLKQCEGAIENNDIFAIELINENGNHKIQFSASIEQTYYADCIYFLIVSVAIDVNRAEGVDLNPTVLVSTGVRRTTTSIAGPSHGTIKMNSFSCLFVLIESLYLFSAPIEVNRAEGVDLHPTNPPIAGPSHGTMKKNLFSGQFMLIEFFFIF